MGERQRGRSLECWDKLRQELKLRVVRRLRPIYGGCIKALKGRLREAHLVVGRVRPGSSIAQS